MSDVRELRPARPDPEGESPAYMPKLPWKWIIGLAAFAGMAFLIMHKRDAEELAATRAAVLSAHKRDLAPIVGRYEETVGKINGWVVAAANAEKVEPYVDPRLNLDALHKGQGLYLRIPAEAGRTPDGIITGLENAFPDAIAKCLGLSPAPVGELYARGSFLTSKWIEQAETSDNVMKLRVIAEEIKQRTKRDVPFVAEALKAQWLLFVLERGDNRRDAPVDVYLYDLRTNKLLLRDRIKAQGALVAARIAVAGVKPGAYATGAQTGAAQDCSIANDLRALAGKGATTFTSEPPTPRDAYGASNADQNATQEVRAADNNGTTAAAVNSDTNASSRGAK